LLTPNAGVRGASSIMSRVTTAMVFVGFMESSALTISELLWSSAMAVTRVPVPELEPVSAAAGPKGPPPGAPKKPLTRGLFREESCEGNNCFTTSAGMNYFDALFAIQKIQQQEMVSIGLLELAVRNDVRVPGLAAWDEVARARAALADAEANLAAARHVVEQTAVRSPVAGTIYSLDAGRSEYVEEGKQLLQVADLRHERVRAYFDDAGRLNFTFFSGGKEMSWEDLSAGKKDSKVRVLRVPS